MVRSDGFLTENLILLIGAATVSARQCGEILCSYAKHAHKFQSIEVTALSVVRSHFLRQSLLTSAWQRH